MFIRSIAAVRSKETESVKYHYQKRREQSLVRLPWQIAILAVSLGLLCAPAWSQQVLYSNGAINGTIQAYNINSIPGDGTFAITNSFVISSTSTVTAVSHIGLWAADPPSTLSWIISTSPGGVGTVKGSGTDVNLSTTFLKTSPYPNLSVYSASFSTGSVTLSPGTYYLQLFSAMASSVYVFWDENDGPSTACGGSPISPPGPAGSLCNNSLGSESFQIDGYVETPAVSLSPSILTFTAQPVGTTSGTQSVTLTNAGDATLNITSVATTGDFSQSNDCEGSVEPGGTCTISVVFSPTAPGTRTGQLTVTDNAIGSPHDVSLTGTGMNPDFSVSVTPLSQDAKGGKASYAVSVIPYWMSTGQVPLSCTVQPVVTAGPSCTISPASVTLDGTNTSLTTASVATVKGKTKTPSGDYTLTITGTAWEVSRSATATLSVK